MRCPPGIYIAQAAETRSTLTSEQLQAARAVRWRQNATPILTLEDAQAWLQQTGFCLFLPRKAQLPAPAPSFVEAVLGQTDPTPPRAAIEQARDLLSRLIDADQAIALNLFGTPADHPDFIVSSETLPYVFAMRGDRDWKRAPGSGTTRVSPLVQQIWKVLEGKRQMSATEIKDELGRELTEAAALRALYELWGAMRVVPLYRSGEAPTLWKTLQTRHEKALNAGTNMSQVTALSVLVSLYLDSAVSATSEEVEIFLSPLTSRSKVREAVRGLTATRQLGMISMERETLLHVEGSLPEFDQTTVLSAMVTEGETAPVGRRVPRKPFAGTRDIVSTAPAASFPSRKLEFKKTGGDKRVGRERLPDNITVWPRPVSTDAPISLQAQAPGANPPGIPPQTSAIPRRQQPVGLGPSKAPATQFAASGATTRRERPPARPPWKEKGKPGFAKSAVAKGEKARWPRAGQSFTRPEPGAQQSEPSNAPLGSAAPGPPARTAPFTSGTPSTGRGPGFRPGGITPERSFRPREGGGSRIGRPRGDFKDFKPRKSGDFKAGQGAGDFKRTPRPGAPQRPGGPKPRGDYKDFIRSKPGGFKTSFGTSKGTPQAGFKTPSRGDQSGSRKPPARFGGNRAAGAQHAGLRLPRPGGEYRKPWKDKGERLPGRAGTFRPHSDVPGNSNPAFPPRAVGPDRGQGPARPPRTGSSKFVRPQGKPGQKRPFPGAAGRPDSQRQGPRSRPIPGGLAQPRPPSTGSKPGAAPRFEKARSDRPGGFKKRAASGAAEPGFKKRKPEQ